jgi:hypothetical protein
MSGNLDLGDLGFGFGVVLTPPFVAREASADESEALKLFDDTKQEAQVHLASTRQRRQNHLHSSNSGRRPFHH